MASSIDGKLHDHVPKTHILPIPLTKTYFNFEFATYFIF